MEFLSDSVVLSRMQFALTAIFHILWPVLTTGMGIYLVIVEGLWLKTHNPDYYLHARFWSKFYILNFGIGVATIIFIGFLIPIMLFYNLYQYIVFRGKVSGGNYEGG